MDNKIVRAADVMEQLDRVIENVRAAGGVREEQLTMIRAVTQNALDLAPAMDAERVRHGHWEECMEGELDFFGSPVLVPKKRCSLCRKTNKNYAPPYCPHCGAKMDEEADGNG